MRRFCLTTALMILTSGLYLSTAFAGTATVSWQANTDSDLAGYRVFYGTASRNYSPPIPVGKVTSYTFNNLTDGQTYFFALRAVDDAGNESGYSAEVSKAIPAAQPESEPPTVWITSPVDASAYSTTNANLAFGGTASDNVGVTQVSWTNSAGGSGTASGTTNWSADITLAEGQNVITVTASDAAGNVGSDTLTVTYTPPVAADATAPTVSITSPTTRSRYSTREPTISLSGLAEDNNAVAQVTWTSSSGESGVASGGANWSISDIPLSENANVITVTAIDDSGNKGSRSLTVFYSPPHTRWYKFWSRK